MTPEDTPARKAAPVEQTRFPNRRRYSTAREKTSPAGFPAIPLRSANHHDRFQHQFCIKLLRRMHRRRSMQKAVPVAQTRFPTSPTARTLCKETQGFMRLQPFLFHLDEAIPLFRAIPYIQASPGQSQSIEICHHCVANNSRRVSTRVAINKMQAAIAMQTANLHYQTHWHSTVNHVNLVM